MRGRDQLTASMFSYMSCKAHVPAGHPLRVTRAIVDEALDVMSADFEGLYARVGRPSIPPENLLRALLLQAFYGVRALWLEVVRSRSRRRNGGAGRCFLDRAVHPPAGC